MSIKADELIRELDFTTSTSSGPGGQHVNRTRSRVTVRFDVKESMLLTEAEKELIRKRLASRLTSEDVLILSEQEHRSQLRNKEAVVAKLEKLLHQALVRKKPRKATKPSKATIENRLRKKKVQSEKKRWRQRP